MFLIDRPEANQHRQSGGRRRVRIGGGTEPPYREGYAEERTLVITTTAVETAEDGTLGALRIWLEGDEADLFLEALPVYTPVLEGT